MDIFAFDNEDELMAFLAKFAEGPEPEPPRFIEASPATAQFMEIAYPRFKSGCDDPTCTCGGRGEYVLDSIVN